MDNLSISYGRDLDERTSGFLQTNNEWDELKAFYQLTIVPVRLQPIGYRWTI